MQFEKTISVYSTDYGKYLSYSVAESALSCTVANGSQDKTLVYSLSDIASPLVSVDIRPAYGIVSPQRTNEFSIVYTFRPGADFNTLMQPLQVPLRLAFIPKETATGLSTGLQVDRALNHHAGSVWHHSIVFQPRKMMRSPISLDIKDFVIVQKAGQGVAQYAAQQFDIIPAYKPLVDLYAVLSTRKVIADQRDMHGRQKRSSLLHDTKCSLLVGAHTSLLDSTGKLSLQAKLFEDGTHAEALSNGLEQEAHTQDALPSVLRRIPSAQSDIDAVATDLSQRSSLDSTELHERRTLAPAPNRNKKNSEPFIGCPPRPSPTMDLKKLDYTASSQPLQALDATKVQVVSLTRDSCTQHDSGISAKAKSCSSGRAPRTSSVLDSGNMLSNSPYKTESSSLGPCSSAGLSYALVASSTSIYLDLLRNDILNWNSKDMEARIALVRKTIEHLSAPQSCPLCMGIISQEYVTCSTCGTCIGCCLECASAFLSTHGAECQLLYSFVILRTMPDRALEDCVRYTYGDLSEIPCRNCFEADVFQREYQQSRALTSAYHSDLESVIHQVDLYLETNFWDKALEGSALPSTKQEAYQIRKEAFQGVSSSQVSAEAIRNNSVLHEYFASRPAEASASDSNQGTKDSDSLSKSRGSAHGNTLGTTLALSEKVSVGRFLKGGRGEPSNDSVLPSTSQDVEEVTALLMKRSKDAPEMLAQILTKIRTSYIDKLVGLREYTCTVQSEAAAIKKSDDKYTCALQDMLSSFEKIVGSLTIQTIPSCIPESTERSVATEPYSGKMRGEAEAAGANSFDDASGEQQSDGKKQNEGVLRARERNKAVLALAQECGITKRMLSVFSALGDHTQDTELSAIRDANSLITRTTDAGAVLQTRVLMFAERLESLLSEVHTMQEEVQNLSIQNKKVDAEYKLITRRNRDFLRHIRNLEKKDYSERTNSALRSTTTQSNTITIPMLQSLYGVDLDQAKQLFDALDKKRIANMSQSRLENGFFSRSANDDLCFIDLDGTFTPLQSVRVYRGRVHILPRSDNAQEDSTVTKTTFPPERDTSAEQKQSPGNAQPGSQPMAENSVQTLSGPKRADGKHNVESMRDNRPCAETSLHSFLIHLGFNIPPNAYPNDLLHKILACPEAYLTNVTYAHLRGALDAASVFGISQEDRELIERVSKLVLNNINTSDTVPQDFGVDVLHSQLSKAYTQRSESSTHRRSSFRSSRRSQSAVPMDEHVPIESLGWQLAKIKRNAHPVVSSRNTNYALSVARLADRRRAEGAIALMFTEFHKTIDELSSQLFASAHMDYTPSTYYRLLQLRSALYSKVFVRLCAHLRANIDHTFLTLTREQENSSILVSTAVAFEVLEYLQRIIHVLNDCRESCSTTVLVRCLRSLQHDARTPSTLRIYIECWLGVLKRYTAVVTRVDGKLSIVIRKVGSVLDYQWFNYSRIEDSLDADTMPEPPPIDFSRHEEACLFLLSFYDIVRMKRAQTSAVTIFP